MFGFIGIWISEVGGSPDLDKYLKHADTHLNPTWKDGGLYYKRNDEGWDSDGNFVFMDTGSGNDAIGDARLKVKGAQKNLWTIPRRLKKFIVAHGSTTLAWGITWTALEAHGPGKNKLWLPFS